MSFLWGGADKPSLPFGFGSFVSSQLYKMREDKYLLDLQKIEGSHFLFMDLAANFLAQLRVI